MRGSFLAAVLTLVMSCAESVLAQYGPAQPRTNAEQRFSLGVGLRNDSTEWTYGYDVGICRFFLEGSLHVWSGWEMFGRVGGANLALNDYPLYNDWPRDVSSDGYQAFGTLGLRGLLWESGNWSLGSTCSVSRYSPFDVSKTVAVNAYQTVYVDGPIEIDLGFPITWRFGSLAEFACYAGPTVHFGYLEGDTRTHTFEDGHLLSDEINSLNVRDKGNLGLFFGLQGPLLRTRARWQAEAEYRNGFGGSAGVYWPY